MSDIRIKYTLLQERYRPMITQYHITKRLSSCDVNVELLREIEAYVFSRLPGILGCSDEEIRESWQVKIKDRFGEEILKSTDELASSQLPNSVTWIRMGIIHLKTRSHDVNVRLYVDMGETRHDSDIDLEIKCNNSRESAGGIINGIERIVESRKNYHWIFHLPLGIPLTIIIGLLSFILSGLNSIPPIVRIGLGCLALLLGFITVYGSNVHSYCHFDTPRRRYMKRVWNIIFGFFIPLLLAAGWDRLFSKR